MPRTLKKPSAPQIAFSGGRWGDTVRNVVQKDDEENAQTTPTPEKPSTPKKIFRGRGGFRTGITKNVDGISRPDFLSL